MKLSLHLAIVFDDIFMYFPVNSQACVKLFEGEKDVMMKYIEVKTMYGVLVTMPLTQVEIFGAVITDCHATLLLTGLKCKSGFFWSNTTVCNL